MSRGTEPIDNGPFDATILVRSPNDDSFGRRILFSILFSLLSFRCAPLFPLLPLMNSRLPWEWSYICVGICGSHFLFLFFSPFRFTLFLFSSHAYLCSLRRSESVL